MIGLPGRRCRGEDGVFLILWALLLTALLTMVAIVIDLGALRADRRKDRAAADAAVTAGANDLLPLVPFVPRQLDAQKACITAWEYAMRNLGESKPHPCPPPPAAPCDRTSTPAKITYGTITDGGYAVTVISPVPDGDALMDADAVGGDIPQAVSAIDGNACDRIGIEISYTRQSIFGRVVGNDRNTTTVHSVALSTATGSVVLIR